MNKPGLCGNDTCKTHDAEENRLGSPETDYEMKGQIKKSLEHKKETFLFDATVKSKPPQTGSVGSILVALVNIRLVVTTNKVTLDRRPTKRWQRSLGRREK